MTRRLGITPIDDIAQRPAEAGRIRLGKKTQTKNKKMAPARLDTLRFTSVHRDVLEALAVMHGGKVLPWHDDRASPRDQFELISETQEIECYLMPGGISCWYEAWSGGGVLRRCTGVEAEVTIPQGDDSYLGKVPCLCVQQGVRLCEPYTRLQVAIPGIPFRGVWRLDTKSWNAQAELPGMYDLVMGVNAAGGMVQAVLGRQVREKMVNGRLSSFVMPVLSVRQTLLEIQQGMASAGALAAGDPNVLAIGTGSTHSPSPEPQGAAAGAPDVDDDIVDGLVVDEELELIEDGLRSDARQFNLDPERFVTAMQRAVAGDALEVQKSRLRAARSKMGRGELVPLGFNADGSVRWPVKK